MRSIAQHDPVVEYKMEGSDMFDAMNDAIQDDAIKLLMKGRFSSEKRIETKSAVSSMSEGMGKEVNSAAVPKAGQAQQQILNNRTQSAPAKRDSSKVGRNESCPCGSGKKYKNCCGKNQ